jgi:hypothetical protein
MSLFNKFNSLQIWFMVKTLVSIAQAHTALTVSDILDMHMNTASRLRQKAATVSLFSTSLSLADEFKTPMSYNFERS